MLKTLGGFRVEPARKFVWLRVTLALSCACGFLLSVKLWVSTRQYPLSPVSDLLRAVAYPFDYVWFGSLLLLLAAITFVARPRKLIVAFVALSILLALWDQTRWQPWFYQYLFMLAALAFYERGRADDGRNAATINTCRLVVASIYFWSGMQKFHVSFGGELWPLIVEPYVRFVPGAFVGVLNNMGWLVPPTEVLIGLGLISRKFRNAAVLMAFVSHLSVLALIIPVGINIVVWPWNVAMMLLVWILFWRDAEPAPGKILLNRGFAFHLLVVVLFALLPALSFFRLWEPFLSGALYSNNTIRTILFTGDAGDERLPTGARQLVRFNRAGRKFLDVNKWSYAELNVPSYPARRVSRKVVRRICAGAGNPPDFLLMIRGEPGIFDGIRKPEFYDCSKV